MPWPKGKPFSEEHKTKLRGRMSWNKGKRLPPLSEEHRRKISEGLKGHRVSDETRLRLSLSKMGEKNPMYGKTPWNKGLTKETCEIIRRHAEKQSKERRGKCLNTGRTHFKKGHSLNRRHFLSEDQLRELYIHNELSAREIAEIFNVPRCVVYYWLRKYGIPVRDESESAKAYAKRHPEYVKMLIENSKNAGKHPNKSELRLLEILRGLDSNWRYVGDGSLVIDGRCPDFWDGGNRLVELFGGFWHRDDDAQERVDFFTRRGYDCVVVWNSELKDVEGVIRKIKTLYPEEVQIEKVQVKQAT
jgi:predicted DNA-binding protein YlxM (UPF0122 family)